MVYGKAYYNAHVCVCVQVIDGCAVAFGGVLDIDYGRHCIVLLSIPCVQTIYSPSVSMRARLYTADADEMKTGQAGPTSSRSSTGSRSSSTTRSGCTSTRVSTA